MQLEESRKNSYFFSGPATKIPQKDVKNVATKLEGGGLVVGPLRKYLFLRLSLTWLHHNFRRFWNLTWSH